MSRNTNPGEFEPYEKAIELNLRFAGNELEAQRILKRAKRHLKDLSLIGKLEEMFEAERIGASDLSSRAG